MQKIRIKLYLKGKKFPLFVCDIPSGSEIVLEDFKRDLKDETVKIVEFGQAAFAREEFSHYLIEYKK